MRSPIAAVFVWVALLCSVAWGDTPAWNAVWQSETATERTSVIGQASTMLAGDGASLSAAATVSAAGGKTRFDYRTARRKWSLIDDGRDFIELDPRSKAARMHARPMLVIDRALAERNYTAKEAGKSTIAGRNAREIEIAPREGGPVVLRLWVDDATGFALKRQRYNVDGKLVSGTEYSEVSFGAAVPPDAFRVPDGWRTIHTAKRGPALGLEALGARLGFAVRPPKHLPAGYVLLGAYEADWERWRMHAAELRYTDGLRMLSVFERQRGQEGEGHRHGRGRGERDRGRGSEGRGRRDEDRGRRGEGRRGEGRGRGWGGGFGPPTQETTFVDRGAEKALRYLGPSIVVIVVGDLTEDELLRVARSVDQG